jgi:diguanylate cyclase (GGDEF)-like protein/PAS domain S-box-containing protein
MRQPATLGYHLRVILIAALFWTGVVVYLAYASFHDIERQGMDMAYAEARANLNKDITFRRWATSHGGVYVPISATQPPIPWLAHVPGRDVTTMDGRRLTLLSPATLLRQVFDRYSTDYGILGRITGLRQLNPSNAPDTWERTQLEAFTQGKRKEVWAVADMAGVPHLRYLRAMYMEAGCEKCHAILGYKLGDMRGAIGINLPLTPYLQRIAAAQRDIGVKYGILWLLGLGGIAWAGAGLDRKERQRLAQEAERALAEERYRSLFEQSRDGILIIDPASMRLIEFNTLAHQQLGYSREEFAKLRIHDFEARETTEEIERHRALIAQRGWDDFETLHRHKDGSLRDVQVIVQRLTVNGQSIVHCTFRDITQRKAAERALDLYANIFRHSGEAIMVTDHDNLIVAINPACERLTGYSPDELRGNDPKVLSSGRTPPDTYQGMWASLSASDFWQGELWDRRKDGSVYPKWAAISRMRDAQGRVSHYIASFTDISERKAAEERIDYLAHHDALTGLINRYSLEGRLGQSLLSARRAGEHVAVLFIDMDRFKVINDTLGHHLGDLLLIEISRRLQNCVRESDIVARLGGDEFVIALTGLASAVDAAALARKILRVLGEPYALDGRVLHSTPSIGISIFPSDGEHSEALMKAADTAMYHAKEQGRNNFQFFTTAMNDAASERLALEHDLRQALREGQFVLHYQPQVQTGDDKPRAMEALVRWHHPSQGLIPPLKFIPIAEETGLIEELGEWVLNEACRQRAEWRAAGIIDARIAINLSARQLRAANLVDSVRAALSSHGLRGIDIELEITESAAMENPEYAISQLRALRGLGVRLAIDDFGTGYSSLAYLKLLPIKCLKLDRTFVRDIETDENDAAICAATLALAHSLGLDVVAEGVETEVQRDFLTRHRCDYLQGYLFGKPAPAEDWNRCWSSPDTAGVPHAPPGSSQRSNVS